MDHDEASVPVEPLPWTPTGTLKCENCECEFDVLFKRETVLRIPTFVYCPVCGVFVQT